MSRSNSVSTTPFEAVITDLSHDGRGVTRVDGKAVFVSGALLDEHVLLRLRKRHRHFDEAEVVELITRSPHRVEPRCRHFGECSGCSLQHLDADSQIATKQRVLTENFERIGKVTPQQWLPPLTDQSWGYRRKGRLSVRNVVKKGRVLVGFREESNHAFVADVQQCEVMHPALGPKIGLLADLINGMDAASDIPQIEFAAGDDTMGLVFRHMQPLSESDLAKLTAFGQQHDLAIFLQPGGNSSVHPLWPENPRLAFRIPSADTAIDDVELEFQPLDFVQVNAGMNVRMMARTMELLDPQPTDRVLDLFCGLGNFTLPIARRVAEVVGVEGEHGLVERAAQNAARNGIANARFQVANLFEDQRSADWARQPWDKMLLDPPRAGADKVLEYLPHKQTRRIVYVSCHPASLARDAGILVDRHGFTLKSAGVMDMFPHTSHVESIAVFMR
ncbi:23S rRNA (uracil1939-C5)-methyltransferase [Rhodanobacter sp. ANJX3]|uniref:23S rRNA (uracil(1939)-C(5))-methyltransferase RlmD n=1 Tax=unclassified Rhodanobacter TaxID=2621553 RepID=UPI0015C83D74|nr:MULTISPECIES: 23S rRNA (uracil(1939)-C(5))-methyltransferase RlmD [unclassified Rhodanobacter]MBB5357416.1 23S rRNA (uracil1939-C5)-methyltransferase [Rhodanobacter sp. ANJX3]NYE27464.1 23S rRNA (uracil1939-C5)-methyltransferase [Rhodanobacter sp. K2T2]